MRLHRFYINQEIGSQKSFSVDSIGLVHQLHSVFRLKTGDEAIIFDGSGFDFTCRISGFDKKSISFDVESVEKSRYMTDRKVFLFASVVKKDTFEWIVEKATELGVTDIIPVISERSEKKSLNESRLRKIAIEASEQCGRGDVPFVSPIETMDSVFQKFSQHKDKKLHKIAFHIESNTKADDFLRDLSIDDDVAIFIGPEGGYSLNEIDMFNKNNVAVVTLGDQVLRAETAVVASLAKVLL